MNECHVRCCVVPCRVSIHPPMPPFLFVAGDHGRPIFNTGTSFEHRTRARRTKRILEYGYGTIWRRTLDWLVASLRIYIYIYMDIDTGTYSILYSVVFI